MRNVDYILCEDTRRAQKLKTHFNLTARLVSFHEHNEKQRIPKILSLMERGKTFALISDAGMPAISDPGALLVQELIQRNVLFTCAPGGSAVTTALVLSGFPAQPFTFYGFLPTNQTERHATLQKIAALPDHTMVLYESPQRVVGLLREMGEKIGDRRVAVCRELTKLHEEVIRGTISELMPALSQRQLKGEFTIVIAPGRGQAVSMGEETVRARFQQLIKEGLNKKEALRKLARESGWSRNDLYDLLMK
jgi:16S rRNA (cytidine1402-2'-O)-methyltransferase